VIGFEVELCVADAVLAGAGAWLGWRWPWRGARRDAVAFAAFGAAAGVALYRVGAGAGAFGVLRAGCHWLFCVLLPVLALRAARVFGRARGCAAAVLALAALGEGCYLWAREVEPFRLELLRAQVTTPRLRGLEQPLRIAAIADFQPEAIGAYEVSVFDRLVAEQPDLVLWLGDYLQQVEWLGDRIRIDDGWRERASEPFRAQVRRLSPRLGMFAVVGDVDRDREHVEALFAGTGVRVLEDARAELSGVPIDVIGLSRARSRRPAIDIALAQQLRGERFPVVIGHAPDYMRAVLDGGLRADALFLAGHTHGGQVQVPFFGPLITLSSVPRWLAAGGVFRRGDAWLAVSRGVGMEREAAPRIRFWCRPQILVLDLAAPPR